MANYKSTGVGFKSNGAMVKTERPNRLASTQFVASQQQRGRQLINDWLKALQAAENPEKPNRELLYKLYHNLITDADLTAEWETRRKLRVLGSGFMLYDINNKPVEDASKLLQQKWFTDLINFAFDSKLYGHSLVEVKSLTQDGLIGDVQLLNRRHVIPEKGLHVVKVGDEKGVLYREDPAVAQWLFEFGEDRDLGLLAKAAPYVLFLRFALSAWSEYAEKFVMPVRVGKTNTKDTESLNRLDSMMLDMATASYAILDKDEEFQFIETSKTDGSNVFDKLIATCAAKLSKLINGSVIGEGTTGGSNAKEQVGQDIQDLVTNGDMMWFEGIMNQTILPRLTLMGYPFQDLTFEFNRMDDLQSELTIVQGLLQHFDIPEDEITDKFGWTVTKKDPTAAATPTNVTATGSNSFFE